jgi:hypothetical protein
MLSIREWMSERFYNAITEILTKQQLSISGISRELKKHGYDYHRLIITGYLRALEDIGYVRQEDIPPSKVYTYLRADKNIYEIIAEKLEDVTPDDRLTIAVYLLTNLLSRPCFKQELKLLGIPDPQPNTYVHKSTQENLNRLRADITKINIPPSDPAFETPENANVPREAIDVLLQILKEHLNLEGLKAKHQQTTLL